jgi:hypothetical protein
MKSDDYLEYRATLAHAERQLECGFDRAALELAASRLERFDPANGLVFGLRDRADQLRPLAERLKGLFAGKSLFAWTRLLHLSVARSPRGDESRHEACHT